MKKYIYSAKATTGAILSIAYYADTPARNYRIYYNGSDTGERFEKLGNAENRLKKTIDEWARIGILSATTTGTREEIPQRGSNAKHSNGGARNG